MKNGMFVHLFHAISTGILNLMYHLLKNCYIPTEACYCDAPNLNTCIQLSIKECSEDYSSLSS